jgi:hypothetical protein
MDNIANVDELKAPEVLRRIARSRLRLDTVPPSLTPSICRELESAFNLTPEHEPVSAGKLAHQALLLLAQDVEVSKAISIMAANLPESPEQFDAGFSVGLISAVLMVLQTRVHFERDKQGRRSITVEKKATSDGILKGLVQKLIKYVTGNS